MGLSNLNNSAAWDCIAFNAENVADNISISHSNCFWCSNISWKCCFFRL